MKITTFITALSFLICFPDICSAKNELVMQKEVLNWSQMSISDIACAELIIIEEGRDVPDMRNEHCANTEGKFNVTLSGPSGITVTFFGKYGFKKGNGFLTIKKKDDKKLWLWDLTAFPPGEWHTSEATNDSGAFEAFYNASPLFEQSVSSIKWDDYVQ
ncbi:hypothetical protein JYT29_02880 [Nitrospina gracilis]|nr:hypothetical protein [Nitrospina gracilis]